MRRIEQIGAMLERARQRGEKAPQVFEVTDHLLAPIYMRVLFGFPVDEKDGRRARHLPAERRGGARAE